MAGWRIVDTRDDSWVVRPPDGSPLATLLASGAPPVYTTRQGALRALVAAVTSVDGILDERWESDAGIAFAEDTGPERSFSNVEWTWRDPTQSLVPLMLQQVTAEGHDEAELAGFVEYFAQAAGTVAAQGRFYDNDAGRAARDLLLGERRFGVSVDPGENTTAEWECLEFDGDGFCIKGRMTFTAYEIAGLTMTPFPGFARASIRLAQPALVAASDVRFVSTLPEMPMMTLARGGISYAWPTLRYEAPPADFYRMPEPDLADDVTQGLLVEQDDGGYGVPLTITDAGQVFGHVARWGQCHTGYPDECVQAPASRTGYANFHLGQTRCSDGTLIPTGVLTAGCDHAAIRLRAPAAREHYDNSGVGWATVRLLDGAHGIWCAGALRPDVSEEQADLLRSLSLSGDWRRDRNVGALEMLAVLAVNVPGFPQRREHAALFASATISQPAAYWADDQLEALTSSGIVRRCAHCGDDSPLATLRAELAEANARIDQLTRLTLRRPL